MANKSSLNLLLQKYRAELATYDSTKSGDGYFTCVVSVCGTRFRSKEDTFSKKALAENDAAGSAISAALSRHPAGASDVSELLRWAEDPANRKTWHPFEESGSEIVNNTRTSRTSPVKLSTGSGGVCSETATPPQSLQSYSLAHLTSTQPNLDFTDDPKPASPAIILPFPKPHPPPAAPLSSETPCIHSLKEFCQRHSLPEPQYNAWQQISQQRQGHVYVAEIQIGDDTYGKNSWTMSTMEGAKERMAAYVLGILELSLEQRLTLQVESEQPASTPVPVSSSSLPELKPPSYFNKPHSAQRANATKMSLPLRSITPTPILARGSPSPRQLSPSLSPSTSPHLPHAKLSAETSEAVTTLGTTFSTSEEDHAQKRAKPPAFAVSTSVHTARITSEPSQSAHSPTSTSEPQAPSVNCKLQVSNGNPKSVLNIYCQKQHISLPTYSSEFSDSAVGYIAVLTLSGKQYRSPPLGNKKEAEIIVATEAMKDLGIWDNSGVNSPRPPSLSPASQSKSGPGLSVTKSYKNILQEYMQKIKVKLPDYSSERGEDGLWSTSVTLQQPRGPPITFTSSHQSTKKVAELEVAKTACVKMRLPLPAGD